MCLIFTFEQFLLRHNISGWKAISKQSQTNSSSETENLTKGNPPISVAAFTTSAGLQVLGAVVDILHV